MTSGSLRECANVPMSVSVSVPLYVTLELQVFIAIRVLRSHQPRVTSYFKQAPRGPPGAAAPPRRSPLPLPPPSPSQYLNVSLADLMEGGIHSVGAVRWSALEWCIHSTARTVGTALPDR